MAENAESDIYVQFPEDIFESTEKLWPVDDNNGRRDEARSKELVVVLLGWAGAEHKYLSKYSDYYLKRGCIVIKYITPLRYHFIQTQKLPLLAQRIVTFMQGLKLDDHPVFFHVFSNGGAYTYSYILRELEKSQKPLLDIKGTIFDSAPCPRQLKASYKAMLSIFVNLKSFKYVVAGLVIFYLVCQIFWYHIRTAFTFCVFGDSLEYLENRDKVEAPLTGWLERIVNMRNHNFLFLYSDSDELIPVNKIEKLAKIVEARGSNVKKVRFSGSEHVMHYRRYPKEYSNAVQDFIRSVMMANFEGRPTTQDE